MVAFNLGYTLKRLGKISEILMSRLYPLLRQGSTKWNLHSGFYHCSPGDPTMFRRHRENGVKITNKPKAVYAVPSPGTEFFLPDHSMHFHEEFQES